MPKPAAKGGLLDALLASQKKIAKPKKVQKPQTIQKGGADSYQWHRTNAHDHLKTTKKLPWEDEAKSGENKRAIWIQEVKDVMAETGSNWKDALTEASNRRQQKINGYQTVVDRVKKSYKGRKADDVKCSNPDKCPGRYTKPVAMKDGEVIYRPNAHNVSKVHLTTDAATKILREYYKERSHKYKNGLKGATTAMRQDISKKRKGGTVQSPCPTKLITVNKKNGTTYQKRIVDREHPDFNACRSNWLYRSTPGSFDMQTVDYGEENSPAYGKNKLPKQYKNKIVKPHRRFKVDKK
jgi:hypothetical protein